MTEWKARQENIGLRYQISTLHIIKIKDYQDKKQLFYFNIYLVKTSCLLHMLDNACKNINQLLVICETRQIYILALKSEIKNTTFFSLFLFSLEILQQSHLTEGPHSYFQTRTRQPLQTDTHQLPLWFSYVIACTGHMMTILFALSRTLKKGLIKKRSFRLSLVYSGFFNLRSRFLIKIIRASITFCAFLQKLLTWPLFFEDQITISTR